MALKIGGTTVINDSRGLENISNIKTVNGNALLGTGNISIPSYTHPANHPASVIIQDASNRFVTDAEKVAWNAKVSASGAQTLTDKTLSGAIFQGQYTEQIFSIVDGDTVSLNPANGTIQLWTLGANRSPTATNFGSGQSMTLMIDDGNSCSIAWPSVVWVNVSSGTPTLKTLGFTVVALWKVNSVLYGALVGN